MNRENDLMLMVLGTLVFAMLILLVIPRATDWSVSLSSGHDRPFGASLVYDLLEAGHMMHEDQTREMEPMFVPISDFMRGGIDTDGATWMVVTSLYDPDPSEVTRLLSHVEAGMNVVIAGIPGRNLVDTLGLRVRRYDYNRPAYQFLAPPDTESRTTIQFLSLPPEMPQEKETLSLFVGYHFMLEEVVSEERADADPTAYETHISRKSPLVGRRIPRAESDGQAIMMSVEYGAGQFLLISTPLLLSNYHFWEYSLEPAASMLLAHIPSGRILWDEYYKPGGGRYRTPIQHVIEHDALRPGYYIALFTIFLFMIFLAKREQRAIPVIPEPVNATREYIRQVGHLLRGHDRERKILDKRLLYLADQLDLSSPEADDTEIKRASERYGLNPEELRAVMSVWGKSLRDDRELLRLNKQIEAIYEQID